jgi:hypothetical protein
VGQTDRVRLRNIIVLGKEGLFSWMRSSLDAPLPPRLVDEVTGATITPSETGECGGSGRKSAWKEMKELLVEQGNLNPDWSARDADAEAEAQAKKGAEPEASNNLKAAQRSAERENEDEEEEMAEVLLDEDVQANGGEELDAQDYEVEDQDEIGGGDEREENGFAAQETAHYTELFDRKVSRNEPASPFPGVLTTPLLHIHSWILTRRTMTMNQRLPRR